MQFCIRDDDTSFFTAPEELESAYGEITRWGPVSLAVVPFCRAGLSKGVPERCRGQWTEHPLHENRPLVEYLTASIAAGRFEAMLHGYFHDDPRGGPEFARDEDFSRRVASGRRYLEDLLQTKIRVFVPPHNAIGPKGLQAIAHEGLHLAGTAGLRSGWSLLSPRSVKAWWRLRRWRKSGGLGVPWVLDLGDHCELAGNAVTPQSTVEHHAAVFDCAIRVGGVFCAATHYWERNTASAKPGQPAVGDQLRRLIDRAMATPQVVWRAVGDIVTDGTSTVIRLPNKCAAF